MKKNLSGECSIYSSPLAETLKVEPESVLCTSTGTGEITGSSTGVTWGEGPDAEW
jgi:hypothetical protein